jgi:hypothetical protein
MSGIRFGIFPLPSVNLRSYYLGDHAPRLRAPSVSLRTHGATARRQPFADFPWVLSRQSARSSGWEWTPNFWKIALRWFLTVLWLRYISVAMVATRSPWTSREAISHWRGCGRLHQRRQDARGLDLGGDATEVPGELARAAGVRRFELAGGSDDERERHRAVAFQEGDH